jgi:hypothetical protein
LALRIQPFADSTTVTGSLGTSSASLIACAAWRSTSGERRASPNFFASACSSSLTCLRSFAGEASVELSLSRSFRQLVLLAADLHLLQARELLELGLQDVVGLRLGQAEARDQRLARLVLGADDADDLVEVEEGDQQAFQQVQALFDLLQAVAHALAHRLQAEFQPLDQDRRRSRTRGRPSRPITLRLTRKDFSMSVVANRWPIRPS